MAQSKSSDGPQDVGSPSVNWDYYFNPPQMLFSDPTPPAPPSFTFEVAEQTVGVFDNIIYNETGGGNDGQIVVTEI